MVVHPAYWRETHGSELSKWCIEQSKMDNIGLGVSAVRMGRNLFCHHLGFKEVEVVNFSKDEKKDLSLWICVLDQPLTAEKQTMRASTSKGVACSQRSPKRWLPRRLGTLWKAKGGICQRLCQGNSAGIRSKRPLRFDQIM